MTRQRLAKLTARENLTKRELVLEIRQSSDIKSSRIQKTLKPPKPQILNPFKGPLYIYQGVQSPGITPPSGEIVIDCGFNVWEKVRKSDLNASQMVDSRDKMSFTYQAYVEEVIDGDTLWAVIDLGLNGYTRQKLRLRGIDCPEISTAAGKRAKRFVEKALKPSPWIIINTHKDATDKYDRYLADIFYGKEETFLNQELLDEGLAGVYRIRG
jgi:micrococcal nuclease